MIEICALASGSNGNCYYIGNDKDAVLIDAGVSCKQILLRINEKELDASRIRAVFISHEHIDHVRGARVLSKKLNIPIYFTEKTYIRLAEKSQPAYLRFFTPGDSITIGEVVVHSFLKNHDGIEPCSFRVEIGVNNIGVFTDIGTPCENLAKHILPCSVVFMEANYDEPMLRNGSYPYFLKVRVSSDVGHLSNEQSYSFVRDFAGENLKHIFLSHLSGENNTPELAIKAFDEINDEISVRVASREIASALLTLE